MKKKTILFLIFILVIVILGGIVFALYNNKTKKQTIANENSSKAEKILLYEGLDVEIKCGIQDISVMKITDEAVKTIIMKMENI